MHCPVTFNSKYAVYNLVYHNKGKLVSHTVKVKLKDVIEEIGKSSKFDAIINLHMKYNYKLYNEIEQQSERLNAMMLGQDTMEFIVIKIYPLIKG